MIIGILALQGAFVEHGYILDKLGVEHFEIRQKRDLNKNFDALILPGGESTVIGKLLREEDIFENIKQKILAGLPVFGTCAGLILLAKEVENNPTYLATMDIKVKRNAYGRQLGSFFTQKDFKGIGTIPMNFIRAPYITEIYKDTEILSQIDGKIVAARQKNQLVTAFHPEVTKDLRVHQYFLNMIKNKI